MENQQEEISNHAEVERLRQRVRELEVSDAGYKANEDALFQRNHFVEHILDAEPGLVYIYDLTNRCNTYINREGWLVFGLSVDGFQEVGDEFVNRVFHPDDLSRIADHHRSWCSAPEGEVREIEYRIHGGDGGWHWLHSREVCFARDGNGQVSQILGVAHEISEQKAAEDALRESEEHLRQIIQQMPYPVEICDQSGTATMVNRAFLQMFGIPSANLVEQKYNVFKDTYTLSVLGLEDQIKRAYAGEQVFVPELVIPLEGIAPEYQTLRKGKIVHEVTMFPVFRKDGEVWRVVTIWKDVTQRKEVEDAFARREREFKTLIENIPDVVARFDRNYRHVYANPVVEKEFGTPPELLVGKSHRELGQPPAMADWTEELIRQVFETGKEVLFDLSYPTLAGNQYYLSRGVPEFAPDGTVESALFIHRNISERKRAEEALVDAQARYYALFEQSHDAVFILDLKGKHLEVNGRAAEILGYSLEELRSMSAMDLSAEPEGSKLVLEQILRGEHIPLYERKFRRKNGEAVTAEVNVELVRDSKGQPLHLQSVVRDITERKISEEALKKANRQLVDRLAEIEKLQAELREQALRDPLTGLYNRRYLAESLEHELTRVRRERKSLSVIIMDIDRFKKINDTFGHLAGDEFLVEIAHLISSHIRGYDFACRYGGEEFLLVMPGTTRKVASRRAEVIRKKIEAIRIPRGKKLLKVTVSIGVATYPISGKAAEEVVIKADKALYRSKRSGRNRVTAWDKTMG